MTSRISTAIEQEAEDATADQEVQDQYCNSNNEQRE